MVLMLWPQTAIPMADINKLVLWPATFIQVWAGGRFYRAAWRAFRHGGATMDTLVVVGTTAAWAYSVFVTMWPEVIHEAGLHPETYFDSSTIIIGLVLLGRWLELRARGQTSGAIKRLIGLQARTARLVRGDEEVDVPLEQVQPGDLLRVRPGEKVPVDGMVVEGASRGRRGDADRRGDAGRQGGRRRGDRRDPEHDRIVRHAGHPGRPRDRPGADRRARPARPGQQGADPATGRSDQRRLRADRAGRRRPDLRRSGTSPGPSRS